MVREDARVAQPVEQGFRKAKVASSNLASGSRFSLKFAAQYIDSEVIFCYKSIHIRRRPFSTVRNHIFGRSILWDYGIQERILMPMRGL